MIRAALGDGAAFGAAVTYSPEVTLLGTGGGLAHARTLLGAGPVLAMNAKVVADVELRAVVQAHLASDADATLVLRDDPQADFDLVPAAVYWGRAPQREASWVRLLLVDDWALTSRLRKLLQVVFNARDTLVELDAPVSLREVLGAHLAEAVRGRRVARSLRAVYARRRAARIGPDLSHRRTLVNEVLHTRAVRRAVVEEMRTAHLARRKAVLREQRDKQQPKAEAETAG